MTRWKLQRRLPGRAYMTVQTFGDVKSAVWAFQQHLVPYMDASVRVLDPQGKLVARATPKRDV